MDDLAALLLLQRTPGLRMRGLKPLFEANLKPAEILEKIESEGDPSSRGSLLETRKIFNPEKEIERSLALGIELISFFDPRYPSLLKETADPPLLLYVKGEILESDQAALAIVGTRHPSLYGQEQARRFSRELAQRGLTIVSGFARGIDRKAHEAALEIPYGRTIAVFGSGLDVIYPKEHGALYEEIEERGAVISEFALGAAPLAENFPKRNRIIAGLALGVMVIEAHSRSGSLITAHLAADEGRDVFALPGRVDQIGSRGTHRLLKEGAILAESPEEILETIYPSLWPLLPDVTPFSDLDEEEKIFIGLFDPSPLGMEEIMSKKGEPASSVAQLLTRLELKGILRKRLDGRYERARSQSPASI